MTSGREYASIPERIAWTPVGDFRCATDKAVLEGLASFANFKTGKGAHPKPETLAARIGKPLRTVERSLHNLEADKRIKATWRRKKHATHFDICVDRLATHWTTVKVVYDRDKIAATDGGHPIDIAATGGGCLTAADGGHQVDIAATSGGCHVEITATGGGLIPCRDRSPVFLELSAPTLRAGTLEFEDEAPEKSNAAGASPRGADVCPGDHHPQGRDASPSGNERSRPDRTDEAPTPRARVRVPQRPDTPRRRRAGLPGAQLALVLDVSAGDAAEQPTREEIAAAGLAQMREAFNKAKRAG